MKYLTAILLGGGLLLTGCNAGQVTKALDEIKESVAQYEERISELEKRVDDLEARVEALEETEQEEHEGKTEMKKPSGKKLPARSGGSSGGNLPTRTRTPKKK